MKTAEIETAVAADLAALESEAGIAPAAGMADSEGAEALPAPGATEAEIAEASQVLQVLAQTGFGLLAPNWKVQAAECKALGDAWAPVLLKYFPNLNVSVEAMAIVTTALVIAPRLGIPRTAEPAKPAAPQNPGENEPVNKAPQIG